MKPNQPPHLVVVLLERLVEQLGREGDEEHQGEGRDSADGQAAQVERHLVRAVEGRDEGVAVQERRLR